MGADEGAVPVVMPEGRADVDEEEILDGYRSSQP